MSEIKTGSKIALLIRVINLKINENIRNTFKDSGLTMPQMMVIRILSKHNQMKLSEISNKMNLANSTVSGIIDRLEKIDVVKRVRSKEDKRVVYVELSSKAKELHEGFHNLMNEYLEDIIRDANEEQINRILNGLETLKDLLAK